MSIASEHGKCAVKTGCACALLFSCFCFLAIGAMAESTDAYAATNTGTTYVKVAGTYKNKSAKAVFKKINAKRAKTGAKKLKVDKSLQKAAVKLAAEQAVYYGSTRPSGLNWTSAVPSAYRASSMLRRIGTYSVTEKQALKFLYKKADTLCR